MIGGHFRIQDNNFHPTGKWELNCSSDKEAVPDWEDMTPLQIMQKRPIVGLTATESCVGKGQLFNKIYRLIYDEYINEDNHYASDYLECHVACIYTED